MNCFWTVLVALSLFHSQLVGKGANTHLIKENEGSIVTGNEVFPSLEKDNFSYALSFSFLNNNLPILSQNFLPRQKTSLSPKNYFPQLSFHLSQLQSKPQNRSQVPISCEIEEISFSEKNLFPTFPHLSSSIFNCSFSIKEEKIYCIDSPYFRIFSLTILPNKWEISLYALQEKEQFFWELPFLGLEQAKLPYKHNSFPAVSERKLEYEFSVFLFDGKELTDLQIPESPLFNFPHYFSYAGYKIPLKTLQPSKHIALNPQNLHFEEEMAIRKGEVFLLSVSQQEISQKPCIFSLAQHAGFILGEKINFWPSIPHHTTFISPSINVPHLRQHKMAEHCFVLETEPASLSLPFPEMPIQSPLLEASPRLLDMVLLEEKIETIRLQNAHQPTSLPIENKRGFEILCQELPKHKQKKIYDPHLVDEEWIFVSPLFFANRLENPKDFSYNLSLTFLEEQRSNLYQNTITWEPTRRNRALEALAEREDMFQLPPFSYVLVQAFRALPNPKDESCVFSPLPLEARFDLSPISLNLVFKTKKTPPNLLFASLNRYNFKPVTPKVLLAASRLLSFPLKDFYDHKKSSRKQTDIAVQSTVPKFSEKNPLKEHMLSTIQTLTLPKIKTHVSQYIPSLAQIALFDIEPRSFIKARTKEMKELEEYKLRMPYHFALMPDLQDLNTLSYREEFSVHTEVMQREDAKGYLFSITVQPLPLADLNRSQHTIFFIVDRSGSIEPYRFQVYQRAVSKALSYLPACDHFNIAFFDSKISYLNKFSHLDVNPASIGRAKDFLWEHERGTYFSEANLYQVIKEIHSQIPSQGHTSFVILTKGKTLKNLHKQREKIQELLSKNDGSYSIYTAAVGSDNNLAMLDCLSKLNHGELLYCEANAAFPRKLAIMVKNLANPIADKIHVTAISKQPSSRIQIFPKTCTLPILFQEKPLTIYGIAHDLSDFQLILQGKNGDKWLNISKTISLKDSHEAPKSFFKNFSSQMIYTLYYDYVTNPNMAILDEIERIGKSHNMLTPL